MTRRERVEGWGYPGLPPKHRRQGTLYPRASPGGMRAGQATTPLSGGRERSDWADAANGTRPGRPRQGPGQGAEGGPRLRLIRASRPDCEYLEPPFLLTPADGSDGGLLHRMDAPLSRCCCSPDATTDLEALQRWRSTTCRHHTFQSLSSPLLSLLFFAFLLNDVAPLSFRCPRRGFALPSSPLLPTSPTLLVVEETFGIQPPDLPRLPGPPRMTVQMLHLPSPTAGGLISYQEP